MAQVQTVHSNDPVGFGSPDLTKFASRLFGMDAPDTAQYQGQNDLSKFGLNPYSKGLSDYVANMPGFTPISAGTATAIPDAYKAKDMSQTALPQYDAIRTRINSQYSQNQSQAQDALDRQFAAAGGGPGNGAQAKQTENLAASMERQKGADLQGVNAEEAQTRQGLQQQEAQKEFQSGEANKALQFQSGEAQAGRQMQAGEFNNQMQQEQNQFGLQAGTALAGLNTSWDQAQAEANNNEFNKVISEWQARHSGGLFGGGGFLGTGIGA